MPHRSPFIKWEGCESSLTLILFQSGKGVKVASPPTPLQGKRGVTCFAGVSHFGINHAFTSLFSISFYGHFANIQLFQCLSPYSFLPFLKRCLNQQTPPPITLVYPLKNVLSSHFYPLKSVAIGHFCPLKGVKLFFFMPGEQHGSGVWQTMKRTCDVG